MNIKMRYLGAVAASILMTTYGVCAAMDTVGAGVSSCGAYLTDTKDNAEFEFTYTAWTQGYLSGLNHTFIKGPGRPTEISDHQGQKIWINNHCKANPLKKYYVVVQGLWRELRRQQGLEPDERFIRKD